MANLKVNVIDGNNLKVEVTPVPKQIIQINRGVSGQNGEGIPTGGTTGQVLAKASNANYDTEWETLATVATTGDYDDLIDKPTLGTIASQNANNVNITGGSISGATVSGYIPTTEKGTALGVATLDSSGKVPTSQIPLQGDLNYQGTWNASTNTPTLTSSVGTKGYYYVVDVAGSTNLNGITDWNIGDWAIFNGSIWQKVDNTDAVTSVNGYTGTVVLTQSDIANTANAPTNTNITSMTGVTGGISSPDFVQFDTGITPTVGVGKLQWDTDAGGLQVGMTGGNVNLQIGQELVQRIYNNTGSTLTDGQIVYVTGSQGQRLTVALAKADADSTSATIIGMVTEPIPNNSSGFITTEGIVNSVNTHGIADGTILWLSPTTAGAYTATKPQAPQHLVMVGYVVKGNSTGGGSIFVKVQNGYELDELHDVLITSPTSGNTLIYDAVVGVWKNANISAGTGISVTNGAGSISIANTAPDQTVALTSGTGISVTGTYPNFTVTNTSPNAYDPTNVAITGGSINNTPIGATTATTGKFTTLEATGTSSLGTASAQYIQAVGDATYPQVKAAGSGTNIPLVLQPKGTGALQAQLTDSTATGGNARGANAVDWQTSRGSAGQVASGIFSTIGGGGSNTASVQYSTVAGGLANTASNVVSFVGGGNVNTASGNRACVVGGELNVAAGLFNFVGGGASNSGTSAATVTTQVAATNGVTSGSTSVTLAASNAAIKVGQLITGTGIASFTYVSAISGTSLTLSQNASATGTPTLSFFTPHGVVVGGGNNQATGSYSFIGGGGDAGTAANRNTASGDWSVVAGGNRNIASGNFSFVGGGFTNTASGIGSFIGGGGNFGPNAASGQGAFIGGGWSNTTTGAGAVSLGIGGVANSDYSSTLGGAYGSTRAIQGNTVFAASNNPLGTIYTNQAGLLILARQTTDATATVLASSSNAAGTVNQVILPNNSAYYFKGEVIAGVTGGGNTKGFTIEGVIKRGANAASTTLVGSTVASLYGDAGAAAWTVALAADTTNGGLKITVTGAAATTIRWVAKVETTEMTY